MKWELGTCLEHIHFTFLAKLRTPVGLIGRNAAVRSFLRALQLPIAKYFHWRFTLVGNSKYFRPLILQFSFNYCHSAYLASYLSCVASIYKDNQRKQLKNESKKEVKLKVFQLCLLGTQWRNSPPRREDC